MAAKLPEDDGVSSSSKEVERYTFFYGSKTPFSQWHPCKFTVDGIKYNCAEQYMMHQKAVLFGDEKMAQDILDSDNPRKQKSLGRQVSNFDPAIWNQRCRDIVKDGNYAKFNQNEKLYAELEATVGTVIVEASPRDRIWGIGYGAANPKAQTKATWRGRNWLGYALTDVRDKLMEERKRPVSEDTAVGAKNIDAEEIPSDLKKRDGLKRGAPKQSDTKVTKKKKV